MEGPDSDGARFAVHLPLDPNALLAFAIAGASGGAILVGTLTALPGWRLEAR